jgi:hypothetical protein
MGPKAAEFLEQIPDADLRLFATIELAAALAGVPEPSITHRKQRRPPDFPGNTRASIAGGGGGTTGGRNVHPFDAKS